MDLTLDNVTAWTEGRLLRGAPDREITDVVTDSRRAIPEGSLFVALRGEHFDGHDYVDEAAAKGARAALVERPEAAPDELPHDERPHDPKGDQSFAVVVVDDTLDALQDLAAAWRRQFDIPVVGVTGSNGKTIVKEMLGGMFSRRLTVHRSPASYNSQVGVPLTLLGLRDEHDVAVVEAGISRPGEMEHHRRMISPTAGALTTIGLAHAAHLETLEKTAREKLKLFDGFDDAPLVVPADASTLEAFELPGDVHSFGVATGTETNEPVDEADYLVTSHDKRAGGFDFELEFPSGRTHAFRLNVPGEHNIANAACAAAVADLHGLDVDAIREGLAAYESSPLRLELHTTPSGVTLVNDAYSSDPASARAALSALEQYGGGHRRIAILGDMLDLGERAPEAHRQLGELAARTDLDLLVCHGDFGADIAAGALDAGFDGARVATTETLDELHDVLDDELRNGDVVLFKASRSLELERAAERLLESVAPTRLYIDLDAVRSNYHALRRRIDDAGVMAVVKSFGYGNDSTKVSQTLAGEGVEALAVAYPDEGRPLRDRGLQLPILVLNVLPEEAGKVVAHDLSALVDSADVLASLANEAAERDASVPVHLNVDTGMNRVGLDPDRAPDFARRVVDTDHVELAGVMTHFAAADLPEEDDFTRRQLATFRDVLESLDARGIDPGTVHAANTAAAWRFPSTHFDMVRVGLGLYGLTPSPAVRREADRDTGPLRRALRMTTRIIHLDTVEPGETVGYGRNWRADSRRRVATIAAGYNDGLPRFMSNGGEVLVAGRRRPIVGDVCMDATMVDVTPLDDVEVGDEVVLFGRQGDARITVDEIADRGDTINYEILCNISPRVRRIFRRG